MSSRWAGLELDSLLHVSLCQSTVAVLLFDCPAVPLDIPPVLVLARAKKSCLAMHPE